MREVVIWYIISMISVNLSYIEWTIENLCLIGVDDYYVVIRIDIPGGDYRDCVWIVAYRQESIHKNI